MQIYPWTEQRQAIFLDRYAMKGVQGEPIEHSMCQMWDRVAKAIAKTPHEAGLYVECLFHDNLFIPAGRVLSGAGTLATQPTFYNCYVLGFEPTSQHSGADSRDGIMTTIKRMVELTSRGGGVGINWSVLRPSGSYIRGVEGFSSGPCEWMAGADALANQVRQGGSRTAALMFMLNDWHPDLMGFISDGKRFHRANYSVALSEGFMRAVQNDLQWQFLFPDTTHWAYDRDWNGDLDRWIELGHPVVQHGERPAKEIWQALTQSAWESGNPGVCFLDRANQWNPTSYVAPLIGMNPCGEQPLPANGCCNLGSLNLVALADEKGEIDPQRLWDTVELAVRFLDDVIDANYNADPSISKQQRDVRRIGLGTMGLADVLLLNKKRYGSPESIKYIEELFRNIRDAAYQASANLAGERGPAPAYEPETYCQRPFFLNLPHEVQHDVWRKGLRNLTLLTQAPTGTTSLLAGASSGIEPIFAFQTTRKDATGVHLMEHPLWKERLVRDIPEYCFVSAHEIHWSEHVAVQAKIQQYVDASISKTINLPAEATVDNVAAAYLQAYQSGCKGITVYRDQGDGVLCEACQA